MYDLPALTPCFAILSTSGAPHFGQAFKACRSRSDATCWRWVFHVGGRCSLWIASIDCPDPASGNTTHPTLRPPRQ